MKIIDRMPLGFSVLYPLSLYYIQTLLSLVSLPLGRAPRGPAKRGEGKGLSAYACSEPASAPRIRENGVSMPSCPVPGPCLAAWGCAPRSPKPLLTRPRLPAFPARSRFNLASRTLDGGGLRAAGRRDNQVPHPP